MGTNDTLRTYVLAGVPAVYEYYRWTFDGASKGSRHLVVIREIVLFGPDMGTLRVKNAGGGTVWSKSGVQHLSSAADWTHATVTLKSPFFAFEYEYSPVPGVDVSAHPTSVGFQGDAAIDQVVVTCGDFTTSSPPSPSLRIAMPANFQEVHGEWPPSETACPEVCGWPRARTSKPPPLPPPPS